MSTRARDAAGSVNKRDQSHRKGLAAGLRGRQALPSDHFHPQPQRGGLGFELVVAHAVVLVVAVVGHRAARDCRTHWRRLVGDRGSGPFSIIAGPHQLRNSANAMAGNYVNVHWRSIRSPRPRFATWWNSTRRTRCWPKRRSSTAASALSGVRVECVRLFPIRRADVNWPNREQLDRTVFPIGVDYGPGTLAGHRGDRLRWADAPAL